MPVTINPKLVSWASDIEPGTIAQAEKTARLPIVEGHVALMPDAHVGIGATVGSVIPTKGAVIPSAVGVDIGCGMVAAELDVTEHQLPDSLEPLLGRIERAVPAGVGRGHDKVGNRADRWLANHRPATELSTVQAVKAAKQFGTLGSGNHFFELCVDERGRVWVVLHSGSRGIGNQLAQMHIAKARRLAKQAMLSLEDPDLAWFVQGTPEFETYVADMLWAQDYAKANRNQMMDRAMAEVLRFIGTGAETRRINCHHNFTQPEVHDGSGAVGHPQGRHPGRRRRSRRHPGLDGYPQLHRRRQGQRPQLDVVLARRRPSPQPHQGPQAVHVGRPGHGHGRQDVAGGPGRGPGRRDPRRLQGHRPGHGRPGRPGHRPAHAAPGPELQGHLSSGIINGPARRSVGRDHHAGEVLKERALAS